MCVLLLHISSVDSNPHEILMDNSSNQRKHLQWTWLLRGDMERIGHLPEIKGMLTLAKELALHQRSLVNVTFQHSTESTGFYFKAVVLAFCRGSLPKNAPACLKDVNLQVIK